jgi:ketosteroid isomerase-like protein
MEYTEPKGVALLFNKQINARNLEKLTDLMTPDHTFIDAEGESFFGRKEMEKGWAEFFERYPDYRNIFSRVESRSNFVIMIGHSECSESSLDGPALWTAIIRDNRVAEWRVYSDTEENRRKLEIE